MKYNYKQGVEKQKSRKWLVLPLFGFFGGLYMLANIMSPVVFEAAAPPDRTAKKLVALQPTLAEDRVYIPKINVDTHLVQIEGDETLALEKGAIHRAPESGDPQNGGNFVIAAHRFNLGLTPMQTKARSPFYYINKLQKDDDIYVDYKGTRYAYKVETREAVAAAAVEIEQRTEDDRLTLYSCDLFDPKKAREVVYAKPVGKVVWTDGKPKLKSL